MNVDDTLVINLPKQINLKYLIVNS